MLQIQSFDAAMSIAAQRREIFKQRGYHFLKLTDE
jgi:hypothetical protein